MRQWKQHILQQEHGVKNLPARRMYNKVLLGGRIAAKRPPRIRSSRKRSRKKSRKGIATKTNPALWERCKKQACTKGKLCKHSARKMQWATRCYKKKGGKYKGKRSKSNKLTQWGKEKWRTSSRKKSKGKLRYLPDKAWKNLSKDQIRRTNASKRKGYNQGKQFVKQPKDVANVAKRYRR